MALPLLLVDSYGSSRSIRPDNVVVHCDFNQECTKYVKKILTIAKDVETYSDFKMRVGHLLLNGNILEYDHLVKESPQGELFLEVNLKLKKIIKSIKVLSNYNVELNVKDFLLPFSENDFYDVDMIEKAKKVINQFLESKGYLHNKITVIEKPIGRFVDLKFSVVSDARIEIADVEVQSFDLKIKASIKKRFSSFIGKVFDRTVLKIEVDKLSAEIFNAGYFFSIIDFEIKNTHKNKIVIVISAKLGDRYIFSFRGNKIFSRLNLMGFVKSFVKNNVGIFKVENVFGLFKAKYEKKGIFGTRITFRKIKGLEKNVTSFKVYQNIYVEIKEGSKIVLEQIIFDGVNKLSNFHLNNLYQQHATVLAAAGYLDKIYLDDFTNILKNEYFKNGFVFNQVKAPFTVIDLQKKKADVNYIIKEGQMALIDEIDFGRIAGNLERKISPQLSMQKSLPLNVLTINDDLVKVLAIAKENGYYFAKIKNLDQKMVFYENNFTSAKVVIDLDVGRKVYLNEIIISGNLETNSNVIRREVTVKKLEIITPSAIAEIESAIRSLGLFAYVKINPYISHVKNNKTYLNFLVQVKEKDFGMFEFAPGYRTDVGVKASVKVAYNNIDGMNRSASFQVQANNRFSDLGFDDERKEKYQDMLEYSGKFRYVEPYLFPKIFGKSAELYFITALQRKRFYGFDADIIKVSPSFSKSFTNYFSASLKYQYEYINQFNATEQKDKDKFQIGGLTTFLNLDFRDRVINPRRGILTTFSFEINNPQLFSIKKEDFEVNFYKMILRNSFYIPVGSWVFAASVSAGVEKNLANEKNADGQIAGVIPSIKVFRLNGTDLIRGFEDNEINLVDNKKDIAEFDIDGSVYFSIAKFELRHALTDNMLFALFFDSGRIFVEKYRPFDLRSSVGVTFKLVTPVGTLDFDFGVKLKRYIFNGQKESFGKFHLLIGQF